MQKLVAVLGWALLCGTLACAEGSPSQPATELATPAPQMDPTCGNGKVDTQIQEPCDCMAGVNGCAVETVTCVALGYTGGTLICTNCAFDKQLCTGAGPATGAGSGAGGTGR
ncbi:MAG: hypothetical protein RL701_4328 [Pseudomonadota bacterium]|jgi:hypothetical protein